MNWIALLLFSRHSAPRRVYQKGPTYRLTVSHHSLYRKHNKRKMAYTVASTSPPTKWLTDRIAGQSKYNDRERPPGPCCWVPPFVAWCPGLLETNCFCTGLGNMGCVIGESFRFWCLHLGFVANLCAMVLTAYACLSISMDYFLLSKSSMETLEIKETLELTLTNETKVVTIYLGLLGMAIDNSALATTSPTGQEQLVVGYDQFCEELSGNGGGSFEQWYLDCSSSSCDASSSSDDYFSMSAVISILISVATFFPTFFSQQLRMYSGYDVNCVKNFLTLLGIVTILLNVNVMVTYFFFMCNSRNYEEDGITTVFFDSQGNAYDDFLSLQDNSSSFYYYYKVQYEWKWGWGLIFLVAGTSLKLFDVLCNIAVRTPNVTRDRKEQVIYEGIVFAEDNNGDEQE